MKDYEAGTLYCHTYYEYDSLGRISAKAESNSEMTDAEKAAKAGAEKHLTPWSTLQ